MAATDSLVDLLGFDGPADVPSGGGGGAAAAPHDPFASSIDAHATSDAAAQPASAEPAAPPTPPLSWQQRSEALRATLLALAARADAVQGSHADDARRVVQAARGAPHRVAVWRPLAALFICRLHGQYAGSAPCCALPDLLALTGHV
jgi:hypothetical protein